MRLQLGSAPEVDSHQIDTRMSSMLSVLLLPGEGTRGADFAATHAHTRTTH
jgi:hypothetical protein